jgi:hypothetical protein
MWEKMPFTALKEKFVREATKTKKTATILNTAITIKTTTTEIP